MSDFEKWLEKNIQTDNAGNEFWDLYPSDVLKAGFKVFSKQELVKLLADFGLSTCNLLLDSSIPNVEKKQWIKYKKLALYFLKEKGGKKNE